MIPPLVLGEIGNIMNGWNNRIVKRDFVSPAGRKESVYGVVEAYYDDEGKVQAITEDFIVPISETKDGLVSELKRFLSAFDKPILDYDNYIGCD